jgi:hypothetical protein
MPTAVTCTLAIAQRIWPSGLTAMVSLELET